MRAVLLEANPQHPSLRLHALGGQDGGRVVNAGELMALLRGEADGD